MAATRETHRWGYKDLGLGFQSMEEKFKVDVDALRAEQLSVLKAIYKEGMKHIQYYNDSMAAFKHPELRVKTFDTKYYEEVLPIIVEILRQSSKEKTEEV